MGYLINKLIVICLLFFSGYLYASIEQLENNNDLIIKTWISPDSNLVKGQQILLQVEVSTSQKWQGPLDIEHIEMEGAIILQRENFALHSSRNEKGKNWLVQLWSLVIYPQRAGEFILPNFFVNVGVVDAEGYVSRGAAHAKGLSFKVDENTAVAADIEWIATPELTVTDDFDKSLEALSPGDALLRTVVISAQDLPAMMLPKMQLSDIEGLALYSQPVELVDKANRGDYQGIRTERLTYVIQASGELIIPEQVFYWWDTNTNRLKEVRLAEYRLAVERASLASLVTWPLIMALSLGGILLLTIVTLIHKNKQSLTVYWLEIKASLNARFKLPQKDLERRFRLACKRGEVEQALSLLYQGLDTYDDDFKGVLRDYLLEFNNLELQQRFESLLNSIYAARGAQDSEVKKLSAEMLEAANSIVKEIKKHKGTDRRWFKSVALKLN